MPTNQHVITQCLLPGNLVGMRGRECDPTISGKMEMTLAFLEMKQKNSDKYSDTEYIEN